MKDHELSDSALPGLAPCSYSVMVVMLKPGLSRPAHFDSEHPLFLPRPLLRLHSMHHAWHACLRLESLSSLLCAPLTP